MSFFEFHILPYVSLVFLFIVSSVVFSVVSGGVMWWLNTKLNYPPGKLNEAIRDLSFSVGMLVGAAIFVSLTSWLLWESLGTQFSHFLAALSIAWAVSIATMCWVGIHLRRKYIWLEFLSHALKRE